MNGRGVVVNDPKYVADVESDGNARVRVPTTSGGARRVVTTGVSARSPGTLERSLGM